MTSRWTWVVVGLLAASPGLRAQHPQMPAGMSHEEHMKQMQKDTELKERGARAMGFDQDKTTHHFRLTSSGGAIEVSVKDPADTGNRAIVRDHLREISRDFGRGVFDAPFATHGEVPPGVAVMQRLKEAIAYTYEETADGAMVRIHTANQEALDAVHAFLRYQIKEHATGDPAGAPNSPERISQQGMECPHPSRVP